MKAIFVDDSVSRDKKYSTSFNSFSIVDIVVLFYMCVYVLLWRNN